METKHGFGRTLHCVVLSVLSFVVSSAFLVGLHGREMARGEMQERGEGEGEKEEEE